jgi:aminopeptidase-like protein
MTGHLAAGGNAGRAMHELIARLFPLCRSITGNGVRKTLRLLGNILPLEVREVPTGTAVFDWTVPREWNIRDAFVKDATGRRIIDFQASNLHVMSYSVPVSRRMPLTELREHLHTLPEQPDLIPYRTSYYKENWGFCLSHEQFMKMPDGEYEVCIDSSLHDGHLTYAEHVIAGQTDEEVLISCHVCHPSLANDNLAGIAVAAFLANQLASATRWYTYRFLFIPGTIGSITWLALNQRCVGRIKHGLVLACAGDPGGLTYKRSRRGDAEIDQVLSYVLQRSGTPHEIVEFSPYGYDERQFCSPGFNLPVGCLTRTPHGRYPEYHTSADNLEFVTPEALADTLAICWESLLLLDANRRYVNLNPYCEPQLGKRGLYHSTGGRSHTEATQMAMLWVLNCADGAHTLLEIAQRSGLPFAVIEDAASRLRDAGLLKSLGEGVGHGSVDECAGA